MFFFSSADKVGTGVGSGVGVGLGVGVAVGAGVGVGVGVGVGEAVVSTVVDFVVASWLAFELNCPHEDATSMNDNKTTVMIAFFIMPPNSNT